MLCEVVRGVWVIFVKVESIRFCRKEIVDSATSALMDRLAIELPQAGVKMHHFYISALTKGVLRVFTRYTCCS
jgi:hypothetical protein